MTDSDGPDDKTIKGETDEPSTSPGDTGKPAWRQLFGPDREPKSELEAEVRRRFEEAATEIIQRRLGVPLKDDGTPDVSNVTQEQLDGSMPGLALEMLSAYVQAIKAATRDQAGEGEQPEGESDVFAELSAGGADSAEFLNQAADDIRVVLSFFGERREEFADAFADLGKRVEVVISQQIADLLGTVKKAKQVVAPDLGSTDSIQKALVNQLVGMMRKFGDVVEKSRETPEQFVARSVKEAMPAPEASGVGEQEPDDTGERLEGRDEGLGLGGSKTGEVIILDEVRKRLEEKRQKMEGLPDILNRFLIDAATSQKEGGVNINLDQDFFREHGPALFKHLVDSISKSFVPPKVELTLPMKPEKAGEAEAGESRAAETGAEPGDGTETGESAVKVSVNLDLGNILGRIFKSKESKPDET